MSVSTVELKVILYITWRTVPPRFIAIKAIPIPHPPYKTTNKTQNNVKFFLYPYIRPDLTLWPKWQELLTLREQLSSSGFFGEGAVLLLFLVFFVVIFLFNLTSSFVLCTQSCWYFWMIHSWFPVLFSLTFFMIHCLFLNFVLRLYHLSNQLVLTG